MLEAHALREAFTAIYAHRGGTGIGLTLAELADAGHVTVPMMARLIDQAMDFGVLEHSPEDGDDRSDLRIDCWALTPVVPIPGRHG